VLALALRARARAGRLAAWRSNASAPYAQALALRGRLAALLEGPELAVAQIRETLPELDRIAGSLNQLAIDVPDPSAEQTVRALVSSLAALRSSLEVLVAAAGGAAQQAATASARERLADLETSLSAFREGARPQPPASSTP
jgi:NAD(P)-dependent dehydrogenase (short-subunit alcohol dehydrogenase family)